MSQVSPLIPWPFELHDGPSPDFEALRHWPHYRSKISCTGWHPAFHTQPGLLACPL